MIEFLAAEAGNRSPVTVELLPFLTMLLVFGIVFLILRAKVWPKITEGLDNRERKLREEIRAAEEARESAKRALADYESNLAKAREEANAMIVKAKTDAKAAGDEMRARNQSELTELKTRATKEIESAKVAAIAELHAEAASLAVAVAGKILQREISAQDQQRLVEDSLRELAGRSGN